MDNLLLAARAAEERGEALAHVLLSGQAGLGKTTIARLLAEECGSGIQEVVAGHIADLHQLISLLARLRKGDFLFIDEVHGLGTACQEALYPALEDARVDVLVRDRSRTRTIRVRLEPYREARLARDGGGSPRHRAAIGFRDVASHCGLGGQVGPRGPT